MRVAGLLLILVAAALLALGLVDGSDDLLVGSVGASLLAAIGLVVPMRRWSTPVADQAIADQAVTPGGPAGAEPRPASPESLAEHSGAEGTGGIEEDELADEPPAQPLAPAQALRVARLSTPVLVIDGRPRYHLAECVHLLGREGVPLPVCEATDLGFTPCGLCEPAGTLVARSND